MTEDLPALDENLFVQGDAHGLPGLGLRGRRFDVERFERLHDRAFVRRRKDDLVAHLEASGRDASRQDPAGVEFVDVLQGKPQGLFAFF